MDGSHSDRTPAARRPATHPIRLAEETAVPAGHPNSTGHPNSFDAAGRLEVGDEEYRYYRLDKVAGSEKLPYSLKILLENLLRTEDGANVTADQIQAVASWNPNAEPA